MGYALSDGDVIYPRSFIDALGVEGTDAESSLDKLYQSLGQAGGFWERVKEPFLARDLNRSQVRHLVARGLRDADGAYHRLLDLWHLPDGDYQRFMDFLRHHRLKPRSFGST